MARRNSNNLILLIALIAGIALFASWMMMRNKQNDNADPSREDTHGDGVPDVQFIAGELSTHADNTYPEAHDEPEFIDVDPEIDMSESLHPGI